MAIYRFQPNTPIPNNPFYYPLTDSLSSGGGTPLIIGAGLYVDYATGTIESTAAINVVTRVTGVFPIVVNGSLSEPIVQVEAATPVSPGVVQVGNNLQIAAGVLSVPNASTLIRGAVRLNDTTSSNATDQALTANQGRILQDQINSITAISNLTLAGTLNASTGRLASVTAAGTSKGFAVNGFLPSPVAGLTNYYVIVTVAGSYDPPGAGGPYNAVVGDWFVCDGTVWTYFAVGYVPPYATETLAGVVELATPLETETGTDNTRAVTPRGVGDMYIKNALVTGKGQLIGASANRTPTKVDPGADGTVLTACSGCTTGLTWTVPSANYLPCSIITNKGIIITGTAPNVAAALTLGTNGQYLTVNTATDTGLQWTTNTSIGCSFITNKGTIIVGCSPNFPAPLAVGCNGCILTANSDTTLGVEWAPNTAIPCSLIAGKGALIAGTSSGNPAALPLAGSDNYILRSNSLSCTGLEWVLNPYIPCCILPGKGALVVAESFHTPCALDVGLNGHYLRVNSACALGVEWTEGCPAVAGVTSITAGAGLTGGTITTTGTIALAPTGVCTGTYYYASFTVDADGRITSAGTNSPVTCVTAGEGLCGGTITCMGTICLPTFAGVQGNWTSPTMTVDAKGRITAISNGGGTGVTSVSTGTGLTGGPITSTGTICLANTGVTAGNYGFDYRQWGVCINAQGQIVNIVCIGELYACTTCTANCGTTAFGANAAGTTGSPLSACQSINIGLFAGNLMEGSGSITCSNTFIGNYAGGGEAFGARFRCGVGNVALGDYAMGQTCNNYYATAIGYKSLWKGFNTPGVTALGSFSAQCLPSTSCNVTAIGHCALANTGTNIFKNVTAIGAFSLQSLCGTVCLNNVTVLGSGVAAGLTCANYGVFIGTAAGIDTFGEYVTVVGDGAGVSSKCESVSIGALSGVYSGVGWTNVGANAGSITLTGCTVASFSTNVGRQAGYNNVSGNNVHVGASAGTCSTGCGNTAAGFEAGYCYTGNFNTLVGMCAGRGILGVNEVTAIGLCAGQASGSQSTSLGSNAGQSAGNYTVNLGAFAGCQGTTSGIYSTNIGYAAGCGNCGTQNVIIGSFAGRGIVGDCNTYVGSDSALCSVGGYCNLFSGYKSGCCSSGCFNVILGAGAGFRWAGCNNVVIGQDAGVSCALSSISNSSVIIGQGAGYQATCAGPRNVLVGAEAGKTAYSCDTVAIGFQSALNGTGYESVSVGNYALLNSCLLGNVAIGACAGWCSSCTNCSVLIGAKAACCARSTAAVNIGLGSGLLSCGEGTVAIGTFSGQNIASGDFNILIGYEAGAPNIATICRSQHRSIMIGCATGCGAATQESIYIGHGITPIACSVPSSNAVVLGGPGKSYYYWSGTWNSLSDRSVKTDICDSALGLSFLEKVQPREFTWNYETENPLNGTRAIGVVAQEVLEAVCSTACSEHLQLVTETEGKHWVGASNFIYPLINAVKELSAENRTLRCELAEIKEQLTALAACFQ